MIEILTDNTATIACVANLNDNAVRAPRRGYRLREQTAIGAMAINRDPPVPWSAGVLSSGKLVREGLDQTLPLATACQRLSISA